METSTSRSNAFPVSVFTWLADSIRDIPGIIYPGIRVRNPTRELAQKIYLGNRVENSARVNWETQYEVGSPLSASKGPPVCFPTPQKCFCVLGKHT